MVCDMCGSEGKLYKTVIEGAELKVCHECSKYGKVVGIIKEEVSRNSVKEAVKVHEKDVYETIIEDFEKRIKDKREQLGLTQKDFAKKINQRESIIHKLETGHFKPQMDLIKTLERFLNIKLTEQHEEEHEKSKKTNPGSFTLGDFIKKK